MVSYITCGCQLYPIEYISRSIFITIHIPLFSDLLHLHKMKFIIGTSDQKTVTRHQVCNISFFETFLDVSKLASATDEHMHIVISDKRPWSKL